MENLSSVAKQTATEPGKTKPAAESLTIPKHRFDCVNLAFKETKQALKEKAAEAERYKTRITELEAEVSEARSETAVAILNALNKSIMNYIKTGVEK